MGRSITILLVEDDPNDVLLVRLALDKILPDVPISVVGDGAQAVDYLRGEGPYANRSVHPFPDVVLLDLMLPVMDGIAVLRWIRQQPELKLLPVVALTGSMRSADSQLACEAGANLCALKSQGFRRLAEIVMVVGGAHLSDASPLEQVSPTDRATACPKLVDKADFPHNEPPVSLADPIAASGDDPPSGKRPTPSK